MEKELTFDDFSGKIGQTFTLAEDGVPEIPLSLEECELLRARYVPPSGRLPFSLVFVCTLQALPQRLFQLKNDAMGTITLFLVPIGKDERGFLHQAVFN
jgi:hypothetical protein